MKKWMSGWFTILLVLFLFPGCSVLDAWEQVKDWEKSPQSADSSVTESNSTPSLNSEAIPSPQRPQGPPLNSEGGSSSNSTEKEQAPEPDLMNFEDEKALRAVLEGEWIYCPPASEEPAVWIAFAGDGSFRLRVKNLEDGTVWEDTGFCQLEHLAAGEEAPPDMLALSFEETADSSVDGRPVSSAGDFMILQKTICDGEAVLALLQVNNGDSIFSTCFNDWAPVLTRHTGWQPQGETRKGESFCAAVWKIDYGTQTVWLDDAMEDGSNVGRYEALPYQVAEQLNLANLPDWLLSDGTIWTVQTDDQGRVVEMQPYIYGSDEQLTEEEAADLLFEFGEVRDYLEQGMTMFFEGRTEIIGEEPCVVIALGTNHEEAFVCELFYAVSPSGRIYTYDPFTDSWNAVNMD